MYTHFLLSFIILFTMTGCQLSELGCVDDTPLGGGDEVIYVISKNDVISHAEIQCDSTGIPTPIDQKIVVKEGSLVGKYKLDSETVRLKEKQKTSTQGEYYDISLTGFRKKNDIAHMSEICKLKSGHYICVYRDKDTNTRLLGTLDKPMRFTGSADSGTKPADDPGAEWQFYGVSKCISPFIVLAIDEAPFEEIDPNVDGGSGDISSGDGLVIGSGGGILIGTGGGRLRPTEGVVFEIGGNFNGNQITVGFAYEDPIDLIQDVPVSDLNNNYNILQPHLEPASVVNQAGELHFRFRKDLYAQAQGLEYEDALPLDMVFGANYNGNTNNDTLNLPVIGIELDYAIIADLVPDYAGTPGVGSFLKFTPNVLVQNFNVTSDYNWVIDGNAFSGAPGASVSVPSPIPGIAGITAIGGTHASPTVTFSTNSGWAIKVSLDFDVQHPITGLTWNVKAESYLGQQNFTDGFFLPQFLPPVMPTIVNQAIEQTITFDTVTGGNHGFSAPSNELFRPRGFPFAVVADPGVPETKSVPWLQSSPSEFVLATGHQTHSSDVLDPKEFFNTYVIKVRYV